MKMTVSGLLRNLMSDPCLLINREHNFYVTDVISNYGSQNLESKS